MFGPASIMKKSISSITTLLIGMFVFLSIPSQIPVVDDGSAGGFNARTVPYFITSAIILLSLFIILSDTVTAKKKEGNVPPSDQSEDTSHIRVFLAFGLITIWIISLPYIGFNVATVFLISSIMLLIGNCRWWQIVALSFILSVPLDYLLGVAFRMYLPNGSFFD